MINSLKKVLIPTLAILSTAAIAQNNNVDPKFDDLGLNRVITTSVPFLTLAPDARGGALGDAGAATSPDANATYWNAAKLAFIDKDYGFAISYNPWLRKLVNDMSLNYLTGYKRISKQETISASLLYFDLGSITFTDETGEIIRTHDPKEYSIGVNYSRKLSDYSGVAVGLKFIHSNLSGNFQMSGSGQQTKPGNTAAGDIGYYYRRENLLGPNVDFAFGANISNLGAKISYTTAEQRNFIPTNLRLGTAITKAFDPYNKITFIFDVNKLLVPSPSGDSTNTASDKPLLKGVLGSFADAPGGFKEELKEIILNFGTEYWYHDGNMNPLFAARAGYFHESAMKGNRKYFTLGLGLRYQAFGLDFAYLIPVRQNNPLSESLRFTLLFNFEGKAQESVTE